MISYDVSSVSNVGLRSANRRHHRLVEHAGFCMWVFTLYPSGFAETSGSKVHSWGKLAWFKSGLVHYLLLLASFTATDH